MHLAAFALLLAAPLQSDPASGADPASCRVVLEDLGNLGLRISDGQAVATDVMTGLRQRLGDDAVIFEGTLTGKLKMKKMLGPSGEAQIQEDQIAYLKAATKQAPFRVSVRFGKKKSGHWIELACKNKEGTAPLEKKRFEAASFGKARAEMNAALPDFCPLLAPATAAPETTTKPKKEWSLPPRRD